jgi:ABC-type transport system involved in multi-copper enzyme maturation permease subunit
MNKAAGTIAIVARNELADSIRSRRVVVMVVLYLVGAAAVMLGFIKFLHTVETELMQTLGLTASNNAGGTTATLWKSDSFRRMLIGLFKDRKLAESLLAVPPLALFYGWVAMTCAPALVMLISSSRIAEEVSSGSVRYVMFRAARSHWCLGKFIGQAVQVLVALLLSAAAAWVVGAIQLHGFQPGLSATYMFLFALKAWLYALPFLGLALGVSQVWSSPNLATVFGLIGMVVLSSLSFFSGLGAEHARQPWAGVWEIVNSLTPGAHKSALWWGDAAHLLPAAAFLVGLSVAYYLAGYWRFSRRDL